MTKTTRFAAAAVCLLASLAQASDPPSAETAEKVLKDSPRHGEWADVEVPGDTAKLHAWVVYPERKDKAPVVIVIHEIFGMSDWVRAVTDQLAAEGFVAIAPDLLSGKGPDGGNSDSFKQDAVRGAISKLTDEEVTTRLNALRDYAIKLPAATDKVATVGFCWGGGKSFMYASRQPNLGAAVVYYGTPPKQTDELEKVKCPVAGFYGGDDARVTQSVAPTTTTAPGTDSSANSPAATPMRRRHSRLGRKPSHSSRKTSNNTVAFASAIQLSESASGEGMPSFTP
jgi:carboxymethylenebutenolidase